MEAVWLIVMTAKKNMGLKLVAENACSGGAAIFRSYEIPHKLVLKKKEPKGRIPNNTQTAENKLDDDHRRKRSSKKTSL